MELIKEKIIKNKLNHPPKKNTSMKYHVNNKLNTPKIRLSIIATIGHILFFSIFSFDFIIKLLGLIKLNIRFILWVNICE